MKTAWAHAAEDRRRLFKFNSPLHPLLSLHFKYRLCVSFFRSRGRKEGECQNTFSSQINHNFEEQAERRREEEESLSTSSFSHSPPLMPARPPRRKFEDIRFAEAFHSSFCLCSVCKNTCVGEYSTDSFEKKEFVLLASPAIYPRLALKVGGGD